MEQPNLTPEQAYKRLQEWYLQKKDLSELKSAEHLARVQLATFYFPAPKEGTNRFDLGGGFDLKLTHSMNYKVDEAALENVKQADIKKLKLPWDDLFVYEPKLSIKAYRKLSTEQKKYVDQLLDITEGSPQMDIVPVADTAGQQAHIEAAKTLTGKNVIVEDAEQATEGDYYTDGAGNWWQLSLDAAGWVEVTDPGKKGELEGQRLGSLSSSEVQGTSEQTIVEVQDPDDGKPGNYYLDGEDQWWLMNDAGEWEVCENPNAPAEPAPAPKKRTRKAKAS